MKSVEKYFADRLSFFRQHAGLTQEQLAEKLGVTNHTVGNWEGLRREPDFAMILKIAECLKVAPADFFPAREASRIEPELRNQLEAMTDEQRGSLLDFLRSLS